MVVNNSGQLILINQRERKGAIETQVLVTIVFIQNALKRRARIFENVIVQKHVSFFHRCCVLLALVSGQVNCEERWSLPFQLSEGAPKNPR